jgi:hypothetical protein
MIESSSTNEQEGSQYYFFNKRYLTKQRLNVGKILGILVRSGLLFYRRTSLSFVAVNVMITIPCVRYRMEQHTLPNSNW